MADIFLNVLYVCDMICTASRGAAVCSEMGEREKQKEGIKQEEKTRNHREKTQKHTTRQA